MNKTKLNLAVISLESALKECREALKKAMKNRKNKAGTTEKFDIFSEKM